ncbi:MAG: hypothetical protein KF819_21680 [Labilithrix sp.]|nr:hypothetical protein [Labilithrix sp.]
MDTFPPVSSRSFPYAEGSETPSEARRRTYIDWPMHTPNAELRSASPASPEVMSEAGVGVQAR